MKLLYCRSMIDEILPIDMRKMKDINELHTQMCNIVQAMVFNKNKIQQEINNRLRIWIRVFGALV